MRGSCEEQPKTRLPFRIPEGLVPVLSSLAICHFVGMAFVIGFSAISALRDSKQQPSKAIDKPSSPPVKKQPFAPVRTRA